MVLDVRDRCGQGAFGIVDVQGTWSEKKGERSISGIRDRATGMYRYKSCFTEAGSGANHMSHGCHGGHCLICHDLSIVMSMAPQ